MEPNSPGTGFVFWLAVCMALPAIVLWIVYYLVSLPMRRQERARLFLDLLEQGLQDGRSPEETLVGVAHSRDASLGTRFHMLASHVECGLRLSHAIEKVPRLLPPQLNAMLKTGEEIGSVRSVLPACRRMLADGVSQTRGSMNYLIILAFVLIPVTPVVLFMIARFVFPRYVFILREYEVPVPAMATLVVDNVGTLALVVTIVALLFYAVGFAVLGGPRLAGWLQSGLIPFADALALRLPWRRKRMLRDFAAMLGLLLDGDVPEERAVELAARSTANLVFQRRAERVIRDLRAGRKLADALRHLEGTGELRWRIETAANSDKSFRIALDGWLEALDAKAFQQQQGAAHIITSGLVLFHGGIVGVFVICVFQALIAVINTGALW